MALSGAAAAAVVIALFPYSSKADGPLPQGIEGPMQQQDSVAPGRGGGRAGCLYWVFMTRGRRRRKKAEGR